jgi:small subunit ribosomal protein S17
MNKPAHQQFTGVVVRRSGDKTVAVEIVQHIRHPLYAKKMTRTKRFLAHDPQNTAVVGQVVVIEAARPRSRHKQWKIVTP